MIQQDQQNHKVPLNSCRSHPSSLRKQFKKITIFFYHKITSKMSARALHTYPLFLVCIQNAGLSYFMILSYLLSSLLSQVVSPTQAEYLLPVQGKPPEKRRKIMKQDRPDRMVSHYFSPHCTDPLNLQFPPAGLALFAANFLFFQ